MSIHKLTMRGAAEELATDDASPRRMRAWLNKLAVANVIDSLGKAGPHERSSYEFDRHTIVAAAILRALWDCGIQDKPTLRAAYDLLIKSQHDGITLIEHALRDCAMDGERETKFIVVYWDTPAGRRTTLAVRFTGDTAPLAAEDEWRPIMSCGLWLPLILERFIGNENNVVAFAPRGEA